MFGDVGWMEILVLALVGLFVFGPERLPKVAADAARQIRALRKLAADATKDLRAEMGPELNELADLHPRRIMSSLLDEDDDVVPAQRAAAAAPPLGFGERPPYDADAT